MKHKIRHTKLDYFKAYANYFWKWEDSGEVIVTAYTNSTIVYREDVMALLNDVSPTISPRLGTVLLIVYACTSNYKDLSYEYAKEIISKAENDDTVSTEVLEYHMVKAFKLLKKIKELPYALKIGQRRIVLLTELLKENQISISNFNEILKEFNTGINDDILFKEKHKITYAEILADFHILSKVEGEYPSVEVLQEKLETGVARLNKAELTIEKKDFLSSLLKDSETAPLSNLVTYLIGGIKIPISLENIGDLSVGGVSDVTNKGTFDKLLLSELAYDEDYFLSRLINNESLYFKREVAPDNLTKNRVIILDTTIKVWGTPRLLGLALALAFKYHPKSNINTKLILLDGEGYDKKEITSVEEVKEVLKVLSPYLDCSKSLELILSSDEIEKNDQVLFLVEESNFKEEKLQKVFNTNSLIFDFLITITREGNLNYLSVINGIIKSLGETKLDINTIINKERILKKKKLKRVKEALPFIPSFYREAPNYPFLSTLIQYPKKKDIIYLPENKGVILKNKFNELVHFPKNTKSGKGKGGFILKNNIGNYHCKFTLSKSGKEVYVLTYTIRKMAGFSIINLQDFSVDYYDLKQSITQEFKNAKVTVYEEGFYINTGRESKYKFDVQSLSLIAINHIKPEEKKPTDEVDFNVGWAETPFVKVKKISITEAGNLVLNNKILVFRKLSYNDNYECCFTDEYDFKVQTNNKEINYLVTEKVNVLAKVALFDNPKLRFRYATFKDGSEILFDNKGYAHLRSSDESLPEITIKLSLNTSPSFYINNGVVAGASNLINERLMLEIVKTEEINKKYLKPFIQNIKKAL